METKELDLVQLIRQLRDCVILDRKDYEKLVQNSKSTECNKSALEARDASIKLLEQQLARQEDWVNYWKNKKVIKYITVAKKLVKNDKNINKKLLSIRLKIANKEDKAHGE